jgi:hypothetical protein
LKPWWREAIDFINVIGNRFIAESGDSKSKKFLFERISFVIQHGSAASIRGTFPEKRIFLTDGKIVANIVDKLKKRYIFLLIC